MKTRSLLTFAALAFCLGVAYLVNPTIISPMNCFGVKAVVLPSKAPVIAVAQPVEVAPAIPVVAAPQATPSRVASSLGASTRALLPSITTSVADWRAYDPDHLTLAAYPDLPMDLQRVTSYYDAKLDRRVWIGRAGTDDTFVTTAASRDEMVAVLAVSGADTYEFKVTNRNSSVRQVAAAGETCDPSLSAVAPQANAVTQVQSTGFAADLKASTAADLYVSDVAVFYNSVTLAEAGSEASLLTTVTARFAASNQALAQSGVTNFQWSVTGVYPVPEYTTTAAMADDLSMMQSSTTEVGKLVAAKSAEVGADQSLLLVGGSRDWAGLATVGGYDSVVLFNQVSYMTIAHELAHNLGCRHDRVADKAADSDGFYYYGHTLTANGSSYGTIMSYSGQRTNYFSNPEVTFLGAPTGVALDQPKAAHNAKKIGESAARLTSHRSPSTIPVITGQPTNVTVNAGDSFSFLVTATGNNLSYQWFKGGVAMSGKTFGSCSVSGAATSDAGTYYVVVTNALGSTQSNNATVTVNVVAPPVTPSTPSGGGGGGGAISPAFLLALLPLALARYVHGRRKRA